MRRQIIIAVALLTAILLLLATLTPLFTPLATHLPPHSDLLFHFSAHLILCLTLSHLLSTPSPELIAVLSITLSVLLELIQHFTDNRSADILDIIAASLATIPLFIAYKDATFTITTPRPARLYASLFDDDEEDDTHRVASWAV